MRFAGGWEYEGGLGMVALGLASGGVSVEVRVTQPPVILATDSVQKMRDKLAQQFRLVRQTPEGRILSRALYRAMRKTVRQFWERAFNSDGVPFMPKGEGK